MTARRPDSQPPLIVFCITELNVGGAEKCLVELATRLDRDRFRPAVISLATAPLPGEDRLVQRLLQADVQLRFLGINKPRQFFKAVRRLTTCLSDLRPDLVQTFLFHANVVGACAARQARKVPHVAGIRVADPRSRLRHWVERNSTRSTARYVCISHDVARFAVQHIRLPEQKLVVIPNGVDVDRFHAPPVDLQSLGVPADRTILLYVGRLDPQKRVDRLLLAIRELNTDKPRFHLVIVGDGPSRVRLEGMAAEQHVAQHVSFAGWQDEVEPFFAAADVFVMTSDWEGMPNALLEGMAAGLPVVAYECEGVRELLGPPSHPQPDPQIVPRQVNGVRVAALVDRIRQIASNQALSAQLSGENQLRARQHFGLQAMVDAYQQLYESLLAEVEGREERNVGILE